MEFNTGDKGQYNEGPADHDEYERWTLESGEKCSAASDYSADEPKKVRAGPVRVFQQFSARGAPKAQPFESKSADAKSGAADWT